jgi:murein DD-endopeptidase MepM/ murein hydrolase activator NlpD
MTPALALDRPLEADRLLIGAGALLMVACLTGLQLGWSGGVVGATALSASAAVQAFSPPAASSVAGEVLAWPLTYGHLTQAFGPTANTLEPPFGGYAHFHPGIDLAAAPGTPVLASADGEVTVAVARASESGGYGEYVVLRHSDDRETVYAHLEAVLVTPWKEVKAGQILGLLGSTGNSTGPHLHFEYWLNGQPVDPLVYLPSSGSLFSPVVS